VADEEENVNEETPEAENQDAVPGSDAAEAEEPAADEVPGTSDAAVSPAEEVEEEPAAEAEAPADEPDAGTGSDAAEAEEPAADEVPVPTDAAVSPADEVEEEVADDAPAAAAPAEDAEPEEVLHPKDLRKRSRSTHTGEARPQRSGEERVTERVAARRAKATARSRRRAQERAKRGEPGQGTDPAERESGVRKSQLGTVVSDKADKTITVRVDIVRRHRRYEKVVRQSATVHAHDERNEASAGDVVRVIESRPLSKLKRWRLVEVVEKAR
jgi:small subunit ribosomal protein S17